jgi:hypothetical protein
MRIIEFATSARSSTSASLEPAHAAKNDSVASALPASSRVALS